jgi:hypothetical protein
MDTTDPVNDERSSNGKSILIWEVDQSSMGGASWTDEIRCTLRKDGTFSLRQRKSGDDGAPLSFAGTTRIKSPQVSVCAWLTHRSTVSRDGEGFYSGYCESMTSV